MHGRYSLSGDGPCYNILNSLRGAVGLCRLSNEKRTGEKKQLPLSVTMNPWPCDELDSRTLRGIRTSKIPSSARKKSEVLTNSHAFVTGIPFWNFVNHISVIHPTRLLAARSTFPWPLQASGTEISSLQSSTIKSPLNTQPSLEHFGNSDCTAKSKSPIILHPPVGTTADAIRPWAFS